MQGVRLGFWRVDLEADVLVCVQAWPPAAFARAGSKLSGTAGLDMGLPGRAWSSGAPVCIPDMALNAGFERLESAANAGFHAAFPVTLKSGVVGVFEFFSDEVRDADPELLQMMATVGYQVGQFIERTRAEEALRHAREKLAQASRMATVAELSASIAHEINQPLQAVLANGQACRRWLAATPPDIEQARLSAEALVRDAKATADVVGRIRALFRRTAPAKARLDMNKLIVQVCKLMADDIHGNVISLETQLARDVPIIRADAMQIQQVIVNLVRNAIEALAATKVLPKSLLIRSRRDGDNVVVDVRDEGYGASESGAGLRALCHHKGNWHGHGSGDLSLDRRSTRRAYLGRSQ
ncbi:sensor histidine kinase [Paraburkholderia panacisoli]|uniref:sensor histidine kinase n=1 Tax=Paraburkholderia panacisoli TaxID=2603818 RepID=UPI001FEB7A75|nr:GAF domain-containing protein [Paraburkholderia panacisoli]